MSASSEHDEAMATWKNLTDDELFDALETRVATVGGVRWDDGEQSRSLVARRHTPDGERMIEAVLNACPKGGQHRWFAEEGSSGVPYRYCDKCGHIEDGDR